MKKNIFTLTLAAMAVMTLAFSCKKGNEAPTPDPVVLTQTNALITLAGDNLGYACINTEEDGTYIAEYETGETAYEGAAKFLHLPFERVQLAANGGKVTTYIEGTYKIVNNEYVFDKIGTVGFDDQFYATVKFLTGETKKIRSGILYNHVRVDNSVKAPGTWMPVSTEVTIKEGADDAAPAIIKEAGCDLETIAAIAANKIPVLEKYLDLFEGYDIEALRIGNFNEMYVAFSDAQNLGGFWNLKEKSFSYTSGVEKDLKVEGIITPNVENNSITFTVNFTIEKSNEYTYNVHAVTTMTK